MTREHKLALIFGFALVLVVGLLISDNFSASRKSEPGGPAVAEAQQQPIFREDILLAGGDTPKPEITPVSPGTTLPLPAPEPVTTLTMGTNQPGTLDGFGKRVGDAWTDTMDGLKNGTASVPVAVVTERTAPGQGLPGNAEARLQHPDDSQPTTSPVPVTNGMGGAGSDLGGLGVKPGDLQNKPVVKSEPAPASKDQTHRIADGDTLWKIAKETYNDGSLADELQAYNKDRIGKSGHLRVGASLLLPEKSVLTGGKSDPAPAVAESKSEKKSDSTTTVEKANKKSAATTYIVKEGDTLGRIAARLLGSSTRVDDILKANKSTLDHADDVKVGQTLKIPAR